MPPANLVWELGLGTVKLNGGTLAVAAGEGPTRVALKPPDVRVRVAMRFTYRLVEREGGKVLEEGELPLHVFPADLTADWATRAGSQRIVVWDDGAGELPRALSAAKVPFTRVDDLSRVLDRPDAILVGADRLDASPFAGASLLNFARAGSSVAAFEQTRPDRLAEYPLGKRQRLADLQFMADHPLFDRLEPADLQSWANAQPSDGAAGGRPVRPVQLPADEPALELAWWPREAAGERPVPVDALVVAKSIGRGRIVLCQLPLGRLDRDPRSQLFMGNLLSHLATRPQPTPPPSERAVKAERKPTSVPTIDVR